jgi:uncharacterized protein
LLDNQNLLAVCSLPCRLEAKMANQIVWCDIPVTDIDRAIRFYSAVLGAEVAKVELPGAAMGLLPGAGGEASGCLWSGPGGEPSDKGPLLYLNCSGRLDEAVAAAEPNGGKIVQPKSAIAPHGFRAIVLDSEGNRIALHSM